MVPPLRRTRSGLLKKATDSSCGIVTVKQCEERKLPGIEVLRTRADFFSTWTISALLIRKPFRLTRRRVKEIQPMQRIKQYEAWYSCPARAMERGRFPRAYWICRRSAEDGASRAYRGQGLSSARGHIQSCSHTVRLAG